MRKLIISLIILFTFSACLKAQNLDVVEKGYYLVIVKDSIVSKHSKSLKAMAAALEFKYKYPDYPVYVKQPNIEPIVELPNIGNENIEVLIDLIKAINTDIKELQFQNDLQADALWKLKQELDYVKESNRIKTDILKRRAKNGN
jgi:hypothetical protein